MTNLLIVGARPHSIGAAIKEHAETHGLYDKVITAGPNDENIFFNVGVAEPLGDIELWADEIFTEYQQEFHHVVCTVGVNMDGTLEDGPGLLVDMHRSFLVNTLAPVALCQQWLRYWRESVKAKLMQPLNLNTHLQFVAISSNSAGIVRSTGLPYNASKAALSMAVRCIARGEAARLPNVSVYAYEPGWVDDTPISDEVDARLDPGMARTRCPGGRTISREDLASMICHNLALEAPLLNGTTLRVDGGEA